MTPVPDPDMFARHRLFQRVITVLIAQTVSTAASADQIYKLVEWVDMFNYESRIRSLHRLLQCQSSPSNETYCCRNDTKGALLEAYRAFQDSKSDGLPYFIVTFTTGAAGFALTLINYLGFIRATNIYLRKVILNGIVILAFAAQTIACCSFKSGIASKIRSTQQYCDNGGEASELGIVTSCMHRILQCPSSSVLNGYWRCLFAHQVAMLLTTALIPILTIYSCKWRERVFDRLVDEIASCRKPAWLFSLQRSMLFNVKTELESEQDLERRTLEQLEECLLEDYEMLRAIDRSCPREHCHDGRNVKNLMTKEFQQYMDKLAHYNQHLSSIMNKAEAIKELRKLDLQMLRDHSRYLNSMQKLMVPPTGASANNSISTAAPESDESAREDDYRNENVTNYGSSDTTSSVEGPEFVVKGPNV